MSGLSCEYLTDLFKFQFFHGGTYWSKRGKWDYLICYYRACCPPGNVILQGKLSTRACCPSLHVGHRGLSLTRGCPPLGHFVHPVIIGDHKRPFWTIQDYTVANGNICYIIHRGRSSTKACPKTGYVVHWGTSSSGICRFLNISTQE